MSDKTQNTSSEPQLSKEPDPEEPPTWESNPMFHLADENGGTVRSQALASFLQDELRDREINMQYNGYHEWDTIHKEPMITFSWKQTGPRYTTEDCGQPCGPGTLLGIKTYRGRWVKKDAISRPYLIITEFEGLGSPCMT